MARQLITAAKGAGDDAMPAVDTLRKNIYRWEGNEVDISDRYRLLYCRVLSVSPAHFGARPEPSVADTTVIQAAALLATRPGVPAGDLVAYRGIEVPECSQSTVRQEVLMAVPAADLGYPQAAEELLRAGWAYATGIDHRPLMAHLRLQLAGVVWESRPRQGRDLAADGLRYLADGPNAAFLHVRYARAAARLGDADGARQAITQAHEAREREHSDDVLAIGGEFRLSVASQHYLAGSALVQIEGAEREAAEELADAVGMYAAGPAPGEQHGFGVKALASIDLAGIRLRSGALDAAAATLEPVLSLVPAQRIASLTDQMRLVRTELAAPVFRGSAQARELDERIEEFGRDSVTTGLRALPA